jgi:hypothetical protein
MELLVERGDDLNLSWHPGCCYLGNKQYAVGPIGPTGPAGSHCEMQRPTEPTIPKCVNFNISFKNCTTELFNQIQSMLDKCVETDDIQVIPSKPRGVRTKVKTKPDYELLVYNLEKKNKTTLATFRNLMDQLEALGCDIDDAYIAPPLEHIPDEYYEWEDQTDYTYCSFSVRCHSNTTFYKFLMSSGLMEKSFPEWYKLFFKT